MTDDRLDVFRTGHLGPRIPAFGSQSDPAVLLGAVAEALNTCERHGLIVDLERGAVMTSRGYVMPVGDCRLGSRWAVRARTPVPADESSSDKE